MIDFYIEIYNNETKKTWVEHFDSYYLFKKRFNKLQYSKKLEILSRSSFVE